MRNSVKLGTKLKIGFLSVALLLLMLGLLSYRAVDQLEKNVTLIVEEAPLVDAAMKMKITVARDMQTIMEMMAAVDQEELSGIWQTHEKLVKTFNLFADAMLNGAQTEERTIFAAKNEALRTIIQDSDQFHNQEFQPRIAQLYTKQGEALQKLAAQRESHQKVTEVFGEALIALDLLAQRLDDRAEARRQTGVSSFEMGARETAWIEMVRKAKNRLVRSRFTMATGSEAIQEENLDDAEFDMQRDGQAFLEFLQVLVSGSDTEDGAIQALDDPGLQTAVNGIINLAKDQYLPLCGQLIARQRELFALTTEINQLDEAADQAGVKMTDMLGGVEEGAKLAMQNAQIESVTAAKAAKIQMVSGVSAGFIIALVLGFAITRLITKPVNRIIEGLNTGADQVAAASLQVSASSQRLAEGSSEQTAAIRETSSSLEKMSAMTQQTADNAVQANRMMKDANQVVEQANASMDDLTRSMSEISQASEETQKIIKTIDEIAFQTNLLALNAAVEAARAGEAGAGFAVVADEVRNLAMRAADAAKNTARLIEETVKKINGGSTMVAQANEAFSKVAESSRKADGLVSEIANASDEQAQGIEQVGTAVSEMGQVTQQNAANAEESASASQELSAQAEQMRAMVDELVVLVEGRRLAAAAAGRPKSQAAPLPSDTSVNAAKPRPILKPMIPLEDDDTLNAF